MLDNSNIIYEDDEYIISKIIDVYTCLQKSSNFKVKFGLFVSLQNVKVKIYHNDELITIEDAPKRPKNTYYFTNYLKDTSSFSIAAELDHILWITKTVLNNCIHLRFNKNIVNQINNFCYFMEDGYTARIDFDDLFSPYFIKVITIIDRSDNNPYYAIIRDEKVYFTYLFEDYSNIDSFIKNNFYSYDVNHFHNGEDVISTLHTSRHAVDIHYKANEKKYFVKVCQFDTIVDEIELLADFSIDGEFNIDTISDLAFYHGLIYDPKKEFIDELLSLNIIYDGQPLNREIIEIYNMATI